MPAAGKVKITRRGFRNAPSWAETRASRLVSEVAREFGGPVRAELRPATYCGPGSAGDRGAYMLAINSPAGFNLTTLERETI